MADPLFRAWDLFLVRAPVGDGTGPLARCPEPGEPAAEVATLRAAAADPALAEAVAVASPSLRRLVDRVVAAGAEGVSAGRLRRAALAVRRYDIRRRTRPTPFGLFAGVADGRFESVAKYHRGAYDRTRTHADMQWLLGLVHALECDADLIGTLTVRAHPALVRRGDRVVLDCPSSLGTPPGPEGRATVSVRDSAAVSAALEHAERSVPADRLADYLAERFGVAPSRAASMVATMVRQELLLSSLRPPLDGGDPLRHLIDVLAAAVEPGDAARAALTALRSVDRYRRDYDAAVPGSGRSAFDRAVAAARALHEHATPLHVDTALDLEVRLPQQVRAEAERFAELAWRLSRPRLGISSLRAYHARFLERYGVDRAVPLLELLDPARGLGPPAGYQWPPSEAADQDDPPGLEPGRLRLVHRLLATAVRDGRREVELDAATVDELAHVTADHAALPASCEITVHVVADSLDALSAGHFRLVRAPSPGSHQGGATLARFGDLFQDGTVTLHAELAAAQVPVEGAVAADLAFLPRSGKAANLAHTGASSGRRISVGLPDADGVEELRLADLDVTATPERLGVVHRPSGREVVPRLGTMVSPTAQAPNAARLLWEIGLEGTRLWEPWNWGALVDAPFTPRVRYGRCVFAPATWRLDVLRGLDQDTFVATLARWREEWRVPERVHVVSNDQRLLLDLDEPWDLAVLRDEVDKDRTLVAQECADGEGRTERPGVVTEVVVPLTRRDPALARAAHVTGTDPYRARSGLGGPWLHLELPGARRNQDDLLRGRLHEIIAAAREHGADRWFFLRYTDPSGHHLRVRLHGEPGLLWGGAVPAVGKVLDHWRRVGLIGACRVGEYDPELERYGGAAARDALEGLFEADSIAALRLLELAAAENAAHDLTTLAVISVAALASAFGTVPSDAARLAGAAHAGDDDPDPATLWLATTGTRRMLPTRYRSDDVSWRRLVDPYGGFPEVDAAVTDALVPRDTAVRTFRRAVDLGSGPRPEIIGSLIHMACNRLFGGDPERERTVVGIARGAVEDNARRRRYRS